MDNKKPLRYWTLEELKRSCQENVGPTGCMSRCPFKSICDILCGEDGVPEMDVVPGDWDLTDPPRWTRDDIEDAKAIKRLYPKTVQVERNEEARGTIVLCYNNGMKHYGVTGAISSLKPGESVPLQEILDAEELLRVNT